MQVNNNELIIRDNIFLDKEKFIKYTLFSSIRIITNDEFISVGINNKNIMFFLNYITESISSISMLGSRNLGVSLIGKLNNIIEYYETNIKLSINFKIPQRKKEYVINAIKENSIINNKEKNHYLRLLPNSNSYTEKELIENLKLIRSSLIENRYFEKVSDCLLELLKSTDIKFDEIHQYSREYFALLMDYVGISVYEIKNTLRDCYRELFENNEQNIFLKIFEKFANLYDVNNSYIIFVKMNKDYDEKLVRSLKYSQSYDYTIYSKLGFEKKIKEFDIKNVKTLKNIISEYVEKSRDNKYFISTTISAKDRWNAIKDFRQKTIEPFIGSMLYSGIRVNAQTEYIIIEENNGKNFINKYEYFDDVFKPLSQDRIDYTDVFKRYVIDNSSNEINKIIDEAVQLLPYYKYSDSILIKFTNTWFALETLYRNASDTIISGLTEYASCLVADRMISGYIYVTAMQISKMYKGFDKFCNNYVENIYINYHNYSQKKDCDFLNWKYGRIQNITKEYEKNYDVELLEAKEILDNAYRLRNKQFHGTKDSKLENMSGFLYDIVNDTIKFYIDYLDVYKDYELDCQALYNLIKNIKMIKSSLLKDTEDYNEKISILYDAVRKI